MFQSHVIMELTTVDALTTKMLDCQSFQTAHSQAHKNRSAGVSFGRLTERCRTPSWWRRARISSCSAARLRKEAKTVAQRADNRYLKGNRGENGNSQFINQIGICENHNLNNVVEQDHRTVKKRVW